ncbi:hypothetical protein BC938DRAFT_479771 [Jimgerdemannia flammicorona]|uniref:Uncharacterized protein n=1 Tax=Jimgerdemannia flammicorona TaxID=994334 RepID=A0A433QK70_9FUNG|nr:hypothetical protein BC938DRAFT_479771 [Jimgerdemannia flammicorona]
MLPARTDLVPCDAGIVVGETRTRNICGLVGFAHDSGSFLFLFCGIQSLLHNSGTTRRRHHWFKSSHVQRVLLRLEQLHPAKPGRGSLRALLVI